MTTNHATDASRSVDVRQRYRLPADFPDRPAWFDDRTELQHHELTGPVATVIDGARRYAVVYGVSNMSMSDVAHVAGVSRASVYKYFGNRSRLVAGLHEWILHTYSADLERVMASSTDLVDQFVAAVHVARWWYDSAREQHPQWLNDLPAEMFTAEWTVILETIMSVLQSRVEHAQRHGVVAADVDVRQTCEWLARCIHSVAVNPGVTYDDHDPDEVERFVRRFVLRGVGERRTAH